MRARSKILTSSAQHLDLLTRALRSSNEHIEAQPCCWLLIDPIGLAAAYLSASFEQEVRKEGGVVITGSWREKLRRPLGGFLDLVNNLAAWVYPDQPELIGRYSLSLVNLLAAWRQVEPLRHTNELRSGLADFILRGDKAGLKHFYWKRDVSTWIVADLVHFTIDAAEAISEKTGQRTVLWLEDIHLADRLTLNSLRLLSCYSSRAPILICATGREIPESDQTSLLSSPNPWGKIELGGKAGSADDPDLWLADKIAPEHVEYVQAASILGLPFTVSDWLGLVAEHLRDGANESFESLVDKRVFRSIDKDHFTLSSAMLREVAYKSLDAERRRKLHEEALRIEQTDPFAAAWHAAEAGLIDEAARYSLRAMERAWVASDFDCAIGFAREHLDSANEPRQIDGDVLLALLEYDAGRYKETEQHLLAALRSQRPGGVEQNTIERLMGYNAIFGLNEFDRGREILESVLKNYEERGLEQRAHSGFVRNSIAFALFRVGRFDDAIEMERLGLELLENSAQPSGFLFSILQLNLGRLYRNLGFAEQAIARFKNAMEAPNSEFSPYMLLIFHCTLAHLHLKQQDYAQVLASYHDCFELSRDLELENAGYPVMNLLSRPVGSLSATMTRGDELFFYLYLNLAVSCRQLGLNDRAEAYMSGMRSNWKLLRGDVWRAAEAVLEAVTPAPPAQACDTPSEFERELHDVENRFTDLVAEVASSDSLLAGVADALADGKAVAVVAPRAVGAGVSLIDSLVLFDPREAALARRINAEVGVSSGFYPPSFGYCSPAARSALVLPEAIGWFNNLEPTPLIFQEATLKLDYRTELSALSPYHVRLQVMSPEFDGILFEFLREFAKRTGIGILAAVPFHLRRRILSLKPEHALNSFLISPVDCLVVGDRLLEKRYGATAEQNLLPFRPRLSQQASIVEGPSNGEQQSTFLILIRSWAYHKGLRLRSEMRPIIDLCDGNRSVFEIVRALESRLQAGPELRELVCRFFRRLWRHGVVFFDEPIINRLEPRGNIARRT
jgi:tetratricopeptide (TPR) repeat protein